MSTIRTKVLHGVDAVIDRHLFSNESLQGYRYFQKRSCNELSKSPPSTFNGGALVDAIYKCIETNLANRPSEHRTPSAQNWRLRSTDDPEAIRPSDENESAEIRLERAIVERWPGSWTYQMPVASGLFDKYSDKRRDVDLVHDRKDGHYDLIELKIESDTPLYAAMEILGYGLVYLASRSDRAANLRYETADRPVLKASRITLCVLAPKSYYADSQLLWLQTAINDGLRHFSDSNFSIDFRFEMFDFKWGRDSLPMHLPEALIRQPVWP